MNGPRACASTGPGVEPPSGRARSGHSRAGGAAVFVAEEGLLQDAYADAADAGAVQWRPQALAALRALQAHGYALLLVGGPAGAVTRSGGRSAAFGRALLDRLAQEASVRVMGILAHAPPAVLPERLRDAAAAHGLDLRQAWFLSSDDELAGASRRVGCRTLRLLEPGRQTHRRWPLLRGQSRMKLVEAATYILRCDGHAVPGPRDPDCGGPGTGASSSEGPGGGPKTRAVPA